MSVTVQTSVMPISPAHPGRIRRLYCVFQKKQMLVLVCREEQELLLAQMKTAAIGLDDATFSK